MSTLVTADRGLGTAYERWVFYNHLDTWATRYEAESFLEGPIDGMAGIRGVHGVGLAKRGLRVTSVLPTEAEAAIAQSVYTAHVPTASGSENSSFQVGVASPNNLGDLPEADIVLAYHAHPSVTDWPGYLRVLGSKAKKALIVAVCNPDTYGAVVLRAVGKLRGLGHFDAPASWATESLSPHLWAIGRVREHVYFDCPWWPDLQVAPGQSLLDRAKRLVRTKRTDLTFTQDDAGDGAAKRFIYDAHRWPYFGGPGWVDELLPAIARHPAFDGGPSALARRTAHLHAFVIDTRPRKVGSWRRSLNVQPATIEPPRSQASS